MNALLKYALIAVMLACGVFWAFFSHETHCKLSKKIRLPCPAHMYHQIIGGVCALLAVALFFLTRTNSTF